MQVSRPPTTSQQSLCQEPWTRYDKYALTYLGGVTLAAIVIHHRVRS